MKKTKTVAGNAALSLTWVPVTLPNGRVRMEMRWRAPRRVQKAHAA